MQIKGLIFDFDGLILDTELPFFQVWQASFESFGCHLTLKEWADSLGTSQDAFDPVQILQKRVNTPIPRDALTQSNLKKAIEIITKQEALPGVKNYLEEAGRLNLKIGLASSSDYAWVTGHLKRLGLIDFFDTICTKEDVVLAKPDPALFNCALNRLNLQPDEAIVFEDSPHGITAAQQARIYCVAVPNALTRQLNIHHANQIIDSFAQTPLQELLKSI